MGDAAPRKMSAFATCATQGPAGRPASPAVDGNTASAAAVREKLTDVEFTAVMVSLSRSLAATQMLRPDGQPYYDSSYDAAIVSRTLPAEEQQDLEARHGRMLYMMVVRTAEIDEHVVNALRSDAGVDGGPAVRQVVLLGAGLDARAWRLPPLLLPEQPAEQSAGEVAGGSGPRAEEPGGGGEEGSGGGEAGSGGGALTFIELDSGSVEQLKMEVLGQPRGCRRVFRVADLSVPEQALEALSAAGHDPSRPTVFVAEGLIGYLTRPAGDGLLAAIRSVAAPGSRLVMTAPPTPAWRDKLAQDGVRLHHVTYEEAANTAQRAREAGWQTQLLSASDLGQKYGMPENRVELILGSC